MELGIKLAKLKAAYHLRAISMTVTVNTYSSQIIYKNITEKYPTPLYSTSFESPL